MTKWLLVIASVLILAIGALWWRSASMTQSSSLKVATPEEIKAHVRALGGQLTLVNFWASWCEPCKKEFPALIQLQNELKDKGLRVVFVTIDDEEALPDAARFLASQQIDQLTFARGGQPLSMVASLFPTWTGAVPASIVLDRDLVLKEAWEGETSYDEFQERLRPHWPR
jgi:thiol-disulfide isomerase/thioredoxin